MNNTMSRTAQAIFALLQQSPLKTDILGPYITLDFLESRFGEKRMPEVNEALRELVITELIEEIEQSEDAYKLTPYALTYDAIQKGIKSQNNKKAAYTPNDLEDSILRFFYDLGRNRRVNKETPVGLARRFKRENPNFEDDNDIQEAISILLSKKYLAKETKSTRITTQARRGIPGKNTSIKTVYISLSGEALLYLKNRNDEVRKTQIYDQSTPYSARRKLEDIFENAKSKIRIGDNYIGRRTLDYLKISTVPIQILTSSNREKNFDSALTDFRQEHSQTVEIQIKDGALHGRFIIADDRFYILDHSIKDFGKKLSSIVEVTDGTVQAAIKKIFIDNWT